MSTLNGDGPVFVDALPGQGRRPAVVWVDMLTPLVERPGTWARLRHYNKQGTVSSTAAKLTHGLYRVPPGRWEFATRKTASEVTAGYDLYARYLGPAEAAS